jgi:hypothetical protein
MIILNFALVGGGSLSNCSEILYPEGALTFHVAEYGGPLVGLTLVAVPTLFARVESIAMS